MHGTLEMEISILIDIQMQIIYATRLKEKVPLDTATSLATS